MWYMTSGLFFLQWFFTMFFCGLGSVFYFLKCIKIKDSGYDLAYALIFMVMCMISFGLAYIGEIYYNPEFWE